MQKNFPKINRCQNSFNEKYRNILTRATGGFILLHICAKAMTKTVLHQKKPQRAGAGGNRCEYLLRGISLLSLSPKCSQDRKVLGRVGTDVFPTLQGTGIQIFRAQMCFRKLQVCFKAVIE